MKFNWGTGIFLFITLFVILGIVFIVFAFNNDVNLVHDEYYKKGVNYDQEIELNKRSYKYKDDIILINRKHHIVIKFSNELVNTIKAGEVYFFRPSNRFKDLRKKLILSSDSMIIEKKQLALGRYITKIKWFNENKNYLIKKEFIIK